MNKILKNEFKILSTPHSITKSLVKSYACVESLYHYNLGQIITDKLKKKSKIGFSM